LWLFLMLEFLLPNPIKKYCKHVPCHMTPRIFFCTGFFPPFHFPALNATQSATNEPEQTFCNIFPGPSRANRGRIESHVMCQHGVVSSNFLSTGTSTINLSTVYWCYRVKELDRTSSATFMHLVGLGTSIFLRKIACPKSIVHSRSTRAHHQIDGATCAAPLLKIPSALLNS